MRLSISVPSESIHRLSARFNWTTPWKENVLTDVYFSILICQLFWEIFLKSNTFWFWNHLLIWYLFILGLYVGMDLLPKGFVFRGWLEIHIFYFVFCLQIQILNVWVPLISLRSITVSLCHSKGWFFLWDNWS